MSSFDGGPQLFLGLAVSALEAFERQDGLIPFTLNLRGDLDASYLALFSEVG